MDNHIHTYLPIKINDNHWISEKKCCHCGLVSDMKPMEFIKLTTNGKN